MFKAIIRTGILAGAAYGAYYLARRFYGEDFDRFVDKASSTVKDIARDVTNSDKSISQAVMNAGARQAG